MTTKWKIVTGFVVMIFIVGTVVFIGWRGIQGSSNGFSEYRRLARLNVAFSDLGSIARDANGHLNNFITSKDPVDIAAAKTAAITFERFLDENNQFAQQDETIQYFRTFKEKIGEFETLTGAVQRSMDEKDRLYTEVLLLGIREIIAQLDRIAAMAGQARDVDALAALSLVWSSMAQYVSGVSRFANTNTEQDAALVRQYLHQVHPAIQNLYTAMPAGDGQRAMAQLNAQVAAMTAATSSMDTISAEVRAHHKASSAFLAEVVAATAERHKDMHDQMLAFGTANLLNNAATQRSMLAIGTAGLVLGIILALVIVTGIIKMLRELAAFAGAITAGDFAHPLNIREAGEIGDMIQAMRTIPDVLSQIIRTANGMADSVSRGHFDSTFDAASLRGSFSDLGAAVNTVGRAFADLINAMPNPVLACKTDGTVIFSNRSGALLVNAVDPKDPLLADADNGKRLGPLALERNMIVKEDVTIHPGGKRMEASVTIIPSRDLAGNPAGYVEIITDLTEIKDKQTTMLTVARDATAIADRVASASTELETQVGRISDGAGTQRERAETTATAMQQMNSTVLEVAKNAGHASEQTQSTRAKALDGAELVNKVVEAVNSVQELGQVLHTSMRGLEQQAESIGGVMGVISDIADQTNLLALNAAIEAARAGDAGRGFAVVADEVRKLAEKTMQATQEVGGNIAAIQESTRRNMAEVDQAVTCVGKATELARASGTALREIVSLATDGSVAVASIATAAEEQSATSEEINGAVDQINIISGQMSDSMIQSSEAVTQLSRMAQELRDVLAGLR